MSCSSTKNKNSKEKCPCKVLYGLKFCGKHIRVKNKIMWKSENHENESSIKIQKVWRGYMIRNLLSLCGDGILNRKNCHNDEELVTLEEKDKQYPLNYFSFNESGKLWWFGLDTILKLTLEEIPTNPYTKQKFSKETCLRIHELRDLLWYRKLIKLPETLHNRCVLLSHILQDHLYEDISFKRFEYISLISLFIFTNDIKRKFTNEKHVYMLTSCINKQLNPEFHLDFLIFQLISTLLYILRSTKNKFETCFKIYGTLQAL